MKAIVSLFTYKSRGHSEEYIYCDIGSNRKSTKHSLFLRCKFYDEAKIWLFEHKMEHYQSLTVHTSYLHEKMSSCHRPKKSLGALIYIFYFD